MPKVQLYEAMQDERDKPKEPVKPIDQWDANQLRRAMMVDAMEIKKADPFKMRYFNAHENPREERSHELIEAMQLLGKPSTKREIAEAMNLPHHVVYGLIKPLVMNDIVTTDRPHKGAAIIYSLVEGYSKQEEMKL